MKPQQVTQQDDQGFDKTETQAQSPQTAVGGRAAGRMLSTQDLAITTLSVTAVVLLAAFLIVQTLRPEPAWALGQNGRAGKYVVGTSQLDDTAEVLMVFNTEVGQMNVYGFNVQAGQLELLQQVDVDQLSRRMQEVRERRESGRRPGPPGRPRR